MKKITIALLLTILASPVLAENNFSAEFLLGIADQKSEIVDEFNASTDDTSIGIRGTYIVNKYFGVELAYQDNGESSTTVFNDTIKIGSTEKKLGIKGMYPLGNGISFIGRLGASFWDYDLKFPEQNEHYKSDGTDLYYGVGVEYALNEQFYAGVEYTITDMDGKLDGDASDIKLENEAKNIAIYVGMTF